MIKLDIEPYCENCAAFEADVKKTNAYQEDMIVLNTKWIRCKHRYLCRNLKNYLKRELTNNEE